MLFTVVRQEINSHFPTKKNLHSPRKTGWRRQTAEGRMHAPPAPKRLSMFFSRTPALVFVKLKVSEQNP